MATFLDLAQLALQHLGVLQDNEVVNGSDGALALAKMNLMLDQWAAEELLIPCITRTTWTIAANTSTYTVGVGGTINVTRPEFVDQVTFYDPTQTTPLEIPLGPLTDDMYELYPYKTMTNVWPNFYWYNKTYVGSLATLVLLPVPSSTLTGVMYAKTALSQIASLSTTIVLPPGYQNLIVTNLAVALASLFERDPAPSLVEEAKNAMRVVKSRNDKPAELGFEKAALFQSNGYSALDFFRGL